MEAGGFVEVGDGGNCGDIGYGGVFLRHFALEESKVKKPGTKSQKGSKIVGRKYNINHVNVQRKENIFCFRHEVTCHMHPVK